MAWSKKKAARAKKERAKKARKARAKKARAKKVGPFDAIQRPEMDVKVKILDFRREEMLPEQRNARIRELFEMMNKIQIDRFPKMEGIR